jgi:hypothetical protein
MNHDFFEDLRIPAKENERFMDSRKRKRTIPFMAPKTL